MKNKILSAPAENLNHSKRYADYLRYKEMLDRGITLKDKWVGHRIRRFIKSEEVLSDLHLYNLYANLQIEFNKQFSALKQASTVKATFKQILISLKPKTQKL